MNVYTFHRAEGFYPIELNNDLQALECVPCNPGTLRVVNENTGVVIYDAPSVPNGLKSDSASGASYPNTTSSIALGDGR